MSSLILLLHNHVNVSSGENTSLRHSKEWGPLTYYVKRAQIFCKFIIWQINNKILGLLYYQGKRDSSARASTPAVGSDSLQKQYRDLRSSWESWQILLAKNLRVLLLNSPGGCLDTISFYILPTRLNCLMHVFQEFFCLPHHTHKKKEKRSKPCCSIKFWRSWRMVGALLWFLCFLTQFSCRGTLQLLFGFFSVKQGFIIHPYLAISQQ